MADETADHRADLGTRHGRRQFLRVAAASTAAAALPGLHPRRAAAQRARTLKIGYVSPQTGPLAGFGETDSFVVAGIRKAVGKGLSVRGASMPVEILVRDSQSDPNRAAEVASRLILSDKVDLMLVSSTPETTNPVSDQCEANGMPCISSVCPWQPWFFGRGGKPETGFKSTFHFFWGLEDIIGVFVDMWSTLPTNKVVGALWPNDGDGNAWSDAQRGFPPALAKAGYKLVDPGRYPNLTDDFSAQISAFKKDNVEIVTGVPIPPDWTTFWKQAAQQGFKPKIATVGKALLFPRSVEALGNLGDGMSTEVWWTPRHPFKSSLTGASAADLAAAYTKDTKKQWTQPLGFTHALFEVAVDVLKRTASPDDKGAIVTAIRATDLNTVVGPVSWAKGPVPNVTKTPLVGGQWGRGKEFRFDVTIVSNRAAPSIPASGKLRPIGQA
ncbi:MAG TPA: ABC transporter substrate-binding protein [Methylomirabilota bacterium]|nr:ABC transporter substrate-binding protein [Methylomirabilota bacterium]